MAASILAAQLERLLLAFGWRCTTNRFTLTAIEPTALEAVRHVWMAGDAAKLSDGEIMQIRPTRIIVQDMAPEGEIERIKNSLAAVKVEPRVITFTHFVDLLWDASGAVERARQDSQLKDPLFKPLFKDLELKAGSRDSRHAQQRVFLGDDEVRDYRLFEKALPAEGTWFALLADAGLGKSELLQWHEWKYSVSYESWRSQRAKTLPPVALRIPLRGLRVLTFDAIAHYLSRPDPDDGLPALTRLNTGACLVELLRMGRIILLLDGVDELMITAEKLEDGLRELRKAVIDGGRIVLAARRGHLTTRRTLEAHFSLGEIARIEPMPAEAGVELLQKYGATTRKAEEIVQRLRASPAHGIPLFLLMAYAVDLSRPLDSSAFRSRTSVLAELLTLFCRRDQPRLGVSTEDQLRFLTEFAHWTSLEGELEASNALELLGLDQSEPAAAIILNPHALLTRTANNTIQFKYPNFGHFFSAKALIDDWSRYGFTAVVDDLRSRKLEEETVEYMASLIDPAVIAAAWAMSGDRDELRRTPLVRRNLLALALARLEDDVPGAKHVERSAHLASLLGERVIADVSLVDLTLLRLDLAGWRVARIQGRGGSIQYCTNLVKCDFDGSIHTVDNLDGTDIPATVDETATLAHGAERLRKLLHQVRRKGGSGLIKILNHSECRDMDGWQKLRRAGYAGEQRRGAGGERAWILNDAGLQVMGAFVQSEAKPPRALEDLLKSEPRLRKLLLALGVA